jgi:hypothetical protein
VWRNQALRVVAGEEGEDIKFFRSQFHFLATQEHDAPVKIDLEITGFQDSFNRRPALHPNRRADGSVPPASSSNCGRRAVPLPDSVPVIRPNPLLSVSGYCVRR